MTRSRSATKLRSIARDAERARLAVRSRSFMSSIQVGFMGCTIIARCQLAKARILFQSWQRHHPDAAFIVLILDSPSGFFHPESEAFSAVRPSQLGIPNVEGFLFQYPFPDVVSSILPYFLSYLFETRAIDKVLYLS